MAIGEAGTLDANTASTNEAIEVTLDVPLDNPVIVLLGTNSGGNKYVLRVLDQETDTDPTSDTFGFTTSFTFTIEEYEYEDGPHPAIETINWLAIEEGVHTLPDGRTIEAGRAEVGETPETQTLTGSYGSSDPVILTQVEGAPDGNVVDSDPDNISGNTFTLELNQGEGQNDTLAEQSVGYIAVQQGNALDSGSAQVSTGLDEGSNVFDLPQDFTNPIVLAETQTINGGDPGTVIINDNGSIDPANQVDLEFEEEQGGDTELDHTNEDVGIVVFEDGLVMCFVTGTYIQTYRGAVEIEHLKAGDLILTQDHGYQELLWLGKKTIHQTSMNADRNLRPIRIPKDAFGKGLPSHDLQLSQQHRLAFGSAHSKLLFDQSEIFVPAKFLNCAKLETVTTNVTYYHMMFAKHQIVFANNVACESLLPGELARDALGQKSAEELFKIFPELRSLPSSYGPPARQILKSYEAQVFAQYSGL